MTRKIVRREYRKLAVSMPERLARAVETEVKRGDAASVSAFVARAVEEKLERDELRELLTASFRERPMTAEERAWADRILGD